MASVVLRQMIARSPGPRPPGECEHRLAGLLVGGGGDLGLVAGAAMDARVPRQELAHAVGHRRQCRSRGRRVQAEIGPGGAVDTRHLESVADEADREQGSDHGALGTAHAAASSVWVGSGNEASVGGFDGG